MHSQKCKKSNPFIKKCAKKSDPSAKKKRCTRPNLSSAAIWGTPWGPVLQPLSLCYNLGLRTDILGIVGCDGKELVQL